MIKCPLIEQRGEERRGEERRGEGGIGEEMSGARVLKMGSHSVLRAGDCLGSESLLSLLWHPS